MVDSDWDEEPTVQTAQPLRNEQFLRHENGNNIWNQPPRNRNYESSERSRPFNDNRNSQTIKIESKFVGRIIGKGGCKIKELQEETNAKINVIKKVSNEEEVDILISGEDSEIKAAILRITELTEERRNVPNRINNHQLNDYSTRIETPNKQERGPICWDILGKNSEIRNKERFGNLPDIVKNFYTESSRISKLTYSEVDEIRTSKNNIAVRDLHPDLGREILKPVLSFEDVFENYPDVMACIRKAGFKEPSPIQCQAWPIIMSGYDLIGIAQTGTGKTLAFLLPALIHIDSQPTPRQERHGPTCLILSPTRELAQQIHTEVEKFNYHGIRSVCVYGGGSRKNQISSVEKGVEIIIATPGRLNDLIMNNVVVLSSVTFLVLDEADRMLDLGFEPEIRKVLFDIRPDRQTVMTSATWPVGVTRLINNYMKQPMQINVGSLNLTACKNVEQRIEFVSQDDKLEHLKNYIRNSEPGSKILVFVGRKITADHLTSDLILDDVCNGAIQCIHGDREQIDREQALSDFKDGSARVLIATDVASRGLDICDINYVINYDFPKSIEEYVHRIGRTGRAGKSGISISYIARENWGSAQSLIDILKDSNQVIPDELVLMAERFSAKMREREAFKSDLTSSFPSHDGGVRLCRTCGKTGHMSRNCNERI